MKKYSKSELDFIKNAPKNLQTPSLSKNSLEIMKKRHLLKDKNGKLLEKPKDMFWRVAAAFALEEEKYIEQSTNTNSKTQVSAKVKAKAEEFYELMSSNSFLPGSRVLYEAGNYIDGTSQLASCFVLPIEDGLDSIFQTMKEAAIVQKNNGGTGFNFSHIRPKGDSVGGTPNVAAGPIHFIRSYSQSFDHILQGKKRGGGNMGILNVDHPDILEFIDLKSGDSVIRNFNLSVGITDKFMEAVKNDEEYELVNPRNNEVVKKLKAREVFDKICQSAWECADPGLFFLDKAENDNPTPNLGVIEATNPCGEEPLRAYESCNLGSVVLPTHLKAGENGKEIDWDKLKKSVHKAVNILDNMIDLSVYPLEKIQKEVNKTRKLGLGLVGLASMFYKMKISYASNEAVELTEKIMEFVQREAEKASIQLAKIRGTFPAYKNSLWEKSNKPVRNATMTSIAPTGTLSLVADTSSGIEPVFALAYRRRVAYQDEGKENGQETLVYVDKVFEEYAKENGFYSKELVEKLAESGGNLQEIEEIPDEVKEIFVTTHDIDPIWHIKMQAAAQKHVDAAVSKTINLPSTATVQDVRKAYIEAWETGCKGITIYRDGSKQMQVLENKSQKSNDKMQENTNFEIFKTSNQPYKNEFELTPNALQVLEKRALKKDEEGNVIETPQELWKRIARYVAGAETQYDGRKARKYEKLFFDIMDKGQFLSGGTLIYAGLGKDAVMSKCLVLPIDDSIDSIFTTLNNNIQMLRRGVGTGFNFSKIRSSYAKVTTTGEYAAGPLEYLKMFNRAQDTIKGRGGRGLGSMAILNVDHPNIEEFIKIKDDLEGLTHYNISVGITNKFMKAVKEDKEWELVDPFSKEIIKTINARELFKKIAEHAWVSGDPGMFFVDHAEKGNTTPTLGSMDGTNPCGEQPLIPYETCNLGNIDVSKFVKGFPYLDNPEFRNLSLSEKLKKVDWNELGDVVELGVRFLDNIIDINNYPIEEIKEVTEQTRNVGLGIMGFADFLVKLGISYKSDEATEAAEQLMKFIRTTSHKASETLGEEKGNFPVFGQSTWRTKRNKKYMRNTRTTTIAPTGSVSIIANCNPGIEPIFALGYRRKNSMGGADQEVIEHLFKHIAKARGFYSEELIKEIADGKHLAELKEKYSIPEDVIEVFVTTHEIEPEQHVRIQAAFQKHVDSAVSKTINLRNEATWRDIAKVYELAHELGCKGITVFRDGSKDPALQVGTKQKTTETTHEIELSQQSTSEPIKQIASDSRQIRKPKDRPDVAKGFTYQIETNQGRLFVTINEDEIGPFEVFLQGVGKSGSFTSAFIESIGRLVSLNLRSGIETDEIIRQLQGIRSGQPAMNPGGLFVYSVPDAVAKILKRHMSERKEQLKMFENATETVKQEVVTKVENQTPQPILEQAVEDKPDNPHSKYSKENVTGDIMECPECGGDLEYAEGCILCRGCGYSKCG